MQRAIGDHLVGCTKANVILTATPYHMIHPADVLTPDIELCLVYAFFRWKESFKLPQR